MGKRLKEIRDGRKNIQVQMQASRPIIIIVYKYVNAATYVKDILRYEWDVACRAGMGTGLNALPDCMGVGSSDVQ